MTDQDKLLEIMGRAFDNGLDWMGWTKPTSVKQISSNLFVFYMPHEGAGSATEITMSYQEIMFDHSFLQAFFENDKYPWSWEHYAKKLVLADNRIDYLYSFVEQAK